MIHKSKTTSRSKSRETTKLRHQPHVSTRKVGHGTKGLKAA